MNCAANKNNFHSFVVETEDGLHVYIGSHGPCDVRYKLLQMMEAHDLLDAAKHRPELEPEDNVEDKIVFDDLAENAGGNSKQTTSWYPDATGFTRHWREFLHIGIRRGLIFKAPLEFNHKNRTYLEFECLTRNYIETGDCETKIVISTRTPPSWNSFMRRWEKDKFWHEKHKGVAHTVATKLLNCLQTNYPPRSEAANERAKRQAKK